MRALAESVGKVCAVQSTKENLEALIQRSLRCSVAICVRASPSGIPSIFNIQPQHLFIRSVFHGVISASTPQSCRVPPPHVGMFLASR